METEVGDIKLDKLIQEAFNEDKDALDRLIVHPWMTATLNEVAGRMAGKYRRKDRDDLKHILIVKIYDEIDTVKNPKGRALCDCLKSWLYSVANHECLNGDRHGKVVKRHVDACVSGESARGKLKSSGGVEHALQASDVPGQEQELREKEQTELLVTAFWCVLSLFPRHKRVMELWYKGKTLKEIAAETKMSISKVSRVEGEVLEAVMIEVENGLHGKRDAARPDRDSNPRRSPRPSC
jgi:RNA polymerase sigma factor (sigma-70 family)